MNDLTHPIRNIAPSLGLQSALKLVEPEIFTFDNGLNVYAFHDSSMRAFRFDLIFRAGSAWHPQPLAASSTLGMLPEGTAMHTAGRLSAKIEYHGANLYHMTTKDFAFLSLECNDKSFHRLLPLVCGMIEYPTFPQRYFKLYLKGKKHEFQQNSQKGQHLASRHFNAGLFGAMTPYGKLATEADFDLLNIEILRDFHRDFFIPKTSFLILSGNITPKIIEIIQQNLGMWISEASIPVDFLQQTDFQPGKEFIFKDNAQQSSIVVGRPVMERNHPDYFGFLVLNTLLGGFFGSRLMLNLREDKGYTYGISSRVSPLLKATGFSISTEVGNSVTRQALEEIHRELNRLMDQPVGEEELQTVKNYLNGIYLHALDGVFNQAEKFKSLIGTGFDMSYYLKSLAAIQETTISDIQRLAQKYLNPEQMLTVVVGKESID